MSRGNVFKVSGSMALGGADYGHSDMDDIKNSLKLLKAKKNQRQSGEESYGYGDSSNAPRNYSGSRQQYNYQALTKNHMPSSQRDTGVSDYSKKVYKNEYPQTKQYSKQYSQQSDPYQYQNSKPPAYQAPSNQNGRNRNIKQVQQEDHYAYEQPPVYSGKSIASKASSKNSDYGNYNGQSSHQQPPRNPPQQRQPPQKKQAYYNDKEERSIKEVNRQNQVDIVEYDPSDLRPCRICDRKFNPDSIKKHQANCKQVFQKKRKQFNAQQHRIVDNNQKKLMKKGQQIEKKLEQEQKNQKIPKWKAQSLAFRAVLKQNRNQSMDPRQAAMIQQAQDSSGVKCPHCGRKFNQNAGPRHIKFCQEQAKKNIMKKKK